MPGLQYTKHLRVKSIFHSRLCKHWCLERRVYDNTIHATALLIMKPMPTSIQWMNEWMNEWKWRFYRIDKLLISIKRSSQRINPSWLLPIGLYITSFWFRNWSKNRNWSHIAWRLVVHVLLGPGGWHIKMRLLSNKSFSKYRWAQVFIEIMVFTWGRRDQL